MPHQQSSTVQKQPSYDGYSSLGSSIRTSLRVAVSNEAVEKGTLAVQSHTVPTSLVQSSRTEDHQDDSIAEVHEDERKENNVETVVITNTVSSIENHNHDTSPLDDSDDHFLVLGSTPPLALSHSHYHLPFHATSPPIFHTSTTSTSTPTPHAFTCHFTLQPPLSSCHTSHTAFHSIIHHHKSLPSFTSKSILTVQRPLSFLFFECKRRTSGSFSFSGTWFLMKPKE